MQIGHLVKNKVLFFFFLITFIPTEAKFGNGGGERRGKRGGKRERERERDDKNSGEKFAYSRPSKQETQNRNPLE